MCKETSTPRNEERQPSEVHLSLIRVESLTKVFTAGVFKKRPVNVIDDVSFTISAGETLGLVGESGCGKSTLARVVLRLIPPSGGRIFFKDTEITKANPKELKKIRTKIQIIFQHPESALNPRMKIYNSLVEAMRLQQIVNNRREEGAKVYQLIELVGLNEEHLERYPHELSGGQIQRVVLARILSLQPEFIVADEPTSMLDLSVQAQVLNLFKEIQQKFNIAYLFISHDLDVVCWMSDRIAVMYAGRIVEIGPVDKVRENPRHPYTSALVGAFFSLKNSGIDKIPDPKADKLPAGCKFYPYCLKAGDICKEKPDFKKVAEDHFVACWQV